jgi:hypothetical protein
MGLLSALSDDYGLTAEDANHNQLTRDFTRRKVETFQNTA